MLGRAISSSPRVGFVVLFLLDGVAVAALEVLRCFLDSPLRAEWEMYSGESSMWRLVRIILQKYLMAVRDMRVASAFAFLVFMPIGRQGSLWYIVGWHL